MSDEQATNPDKGGGPLAALWARLRPTADALFAIDLRALAALRIGLALLILGDLSVRARDLEAHYTDFGVTPREAVYLYDGDRWANLSPYMWVDGVFPVALLMIVAVVFGVMLLLGWKTRLAAFATYFLLMGIQGRNPMVLHGGDLLLRVTMFWAMWTPLGARWSLDGSVAQWRQEGRTIPKRVLTAGTAALLLQVGMVYWFTAAMKSDPEWRRDGTALYYALNIGHYQTSIGNWLLHQSALLRPLSHAAWWMEVIGPTLAFLPGMTARVRTVVVAAFITFHLGILNLVFDLGPFPYIATLVWIPFLPTFVWDALERLWGRLSPANPVRRLTERARATVQGWQSRVVAGRVRAGKAAPSIALGLEWQAAAAFLIVYALLWNVRGLDYEARKEWVPQPINFVARMLRLDQGWGMFAPRPMVDDGWFVMPGKLLKDKDFSFDRFTGKTPIDWSQPVYVSSMYPHERWRKYIMNLWASQYTNQRVYYARWVCRHWNRLHHGGDRLDRFQVYYMRADTKPGYVASKPVKVSMWDHYCFDVPGQRASAPPGASFP
jgi:hypothetical protein